MLSNIIIIDDMKNTMELENDLIKQGYNVYVINLYTDVADLLRKHKIDSILLSINSETAKVFTFLDMLILDENFKYIPVIALLDGNEVKNTVYIEKLLLSGIHDCVVKPYISPLLLHRIKSVIDINKKRLHTKFLSMKDDLTQLKNRKAFCKYINNLPLESKSIPFALFNISNFAKVNADYGHSIGDSILSHIAKVLSQHFEHSEMISRISGDTFFVALSHLDSENAELAYQQLITNIEAFEFKINNNLNSFFHIKLRSNIHTDADYIGSIESLIHDIEQGMVSVTKYSVNEVISNTTEQNDISENTNSHVLLPGIDIHIGLNNVLNDEGLFYEVLAMFYQDHGEDSVKLQRALSQQDILTAKHLSHTLKGVTGSIGATQLHRDIKLLDDAINNNNEEITVLMGYFDCVDKQLVALLQGINTALMNKPTLVNE